jgi:hypothetical protein
MAKLCIYEHIKYLMAPLLFSRKSLSKYLMDMIDFNKHDINIYINDTWQKYAGKIGRHRATLQDYKLMAT